tara:strand:- start:445 stop:669 length:225 start_codon:yes stop_codon:yes gene_type:complete
MKEKYEISKMPKREFTTPHRVAWQDHIVNIIKAIDSHQREYVNSTDAEHQLKQLLLLKQWVQNQKTYIKSKEKE